MSNVSTIFGPTMPAPVAIVPDLDTVMNTGNITTISYSGTGMRLNKRILVGPVTYTPDDNDYLMLCDVSAGDVLLELNGAYQSLYVIKLVNYNPPNKVRISVLAGGTIDAQSIYFLTREFESLYIGSAQNTSDYYVLASHLSNGNVNNGKYVEPTFIGSTITIPHQLNAVPNSAYITAGNAAAAALLVSDYYITMTDTDLIIELTTVGASVAIEIYWGVTKN